MEGRETDDPGPSSDGPETGARTWDVLLPRYARLIYSVPLRFGLDRHDADDVFQATCLTALRRAPAPPPEDRLVGWLASIASWETRKVLRRRRPEQIEPAFVAELREGDGRLPHTLLEELEEQQVLADALQSLRPRERALLEALFLAPEPVSYEKLAQDLGVAVGSIGALRQRAIRRLRRELERRGFRP